MGGFSRFFLLSALVLYMASKLHSAKTVGVNSISVGHESGENYSIALFLCSNEQVRVSRLERTITEVNEAVEQIKLMSIEQWNLSYNVSHLSESFPWSLHIKVIDTCREHEALTVLSDVVSDSAYSAIIGPDIYTICNPAVTIAQHQNKPIISATCSQPLLLSSKSPVLIPSVPSLIDNARAVVGILTYYRWKQVAIVLTQAQPWWDQFAMLSYILTSSGFLLPSVHRFPENASMSEIEYSLQHLKPATKGIVSKIKSTSIKNKIYFYCTI